jgi:hypothetical protein
MRRWITVSGGMSGVDGGKTVKKRFLFMKKHREQLKKEQLGQSERSGDTLAEREECRDTRPAHGRTRSGAPRVLTATRSALTQHLVNSTATA